MTLYNIFYTVSVLFVCVSCVCAVYFYFMIISILCFLSSPKEKKDKTLILDDNIFQFFFVFLLLFETNRLCIYKSMIFVKRPLDFFFYFILFFFVIHCYESHICFFFMQMQSGQFLFD